MALPSKVFRDRLREARRFKNWTQRDLAAALDGVGVKIDASNITRLERGTRGVTLDEVIAIAVVLGVSPLHMIVPIDDNGAQLTPSLTVPTADARAWLRGVTPLQEADERWFYTQTPESEADWFPLVPGPWRFQNQEDLKATRAKWERQILREVIGGRTPQEPGPDAEDIPVQRPGVQVQQPPIVAAIVTSPEGVLVGRRNDGTPPWTFIAGEQDAVKDENPADTAVREVKEETGLRVEAGELIGERVHPKTGRTMIYIAAAPTRGTDIFVGDEDELAEVQWVSLAEADELLPGMYEPVRDYLARKLSEGER